MSKSTLQRSEELYLELMKFQISLNQNSSTLKQNSTLHFLITLTKRKEIICQYEGIDYSLNISYCKSSTTLLKRLSYLQGKKKLTFAQSIGNGNQFLITLPIIKSVQKIKTSVRQLQFLF